MKVPLIFHKGYRKMLELSWSLKSKLTRWMGGWRGEKVQILGSWNITGKEGPRCVGATGRASVAGQHGVLGGGSGEEPATCCWAWLQKPWGHPIATIIPSDKNCRVNWDLCKIGKRSALTLLSSFPTTERTSVQEYTRRYRTIKS